MLLRQVMDVVDIFSRVDGNTVDAVCSYLEEIGSNDLTRIIPEESCNTVFLRCCFPGSAGKTVGGQVPTLGVVGQLGGIRMDREGPFIVSDADGAIVALSVAAKLAELQKQGYKLPGDVMITTHICTDTQRKPHIPVDFVGMPIPIKEMQEILVDPAMDMVISVDTTKGNRILNYRGTALTPVACQGYLLPITQTMIDLTEHVTGSLFRMLPLTTQDLTPYENGLSHLNSIMQPATMTAAPVLGLALTAESTVPGIATNASHMMDLECAARLCLEMAARYPSDPNLFYDQAEFDKLKQIYGRMPIFCQI